MSAVDWAVVYRVLDDDVEHTLLRLRIMDVPGDVEKPQIKKALERAGRTYGEGRYLWGNHSILLRDHWPVDVQRGEGDEPAEEISYADLLDEGNGERRVTLRLPVGLHAALVKSASGASASLNQFCLQVLANAVTYDLSPTAVSGSSDVGGLLGVSPDILQDIIRHTPPETRKQLREQAEIIDAMPPDRAKNRALAALSRAAGEVAGQVERLDAFTDDEWEAMAVKHESPGSGPQFKAQHEKMRASRPEFLAFMSRRFSERSESLRGMSAEDVKSLNASVGDLFITPDAE